MTTPVSRSSGPGHAHARSLLGALLLFSASLGAQEHGGASVVSAKGWRFSVYSGGLPSVENVAVAADGAVYAAQELREGHGQVVRLRNGKAETVISSLDRADGLFLRGRFLYVSEETSDGRVLELNLAGGEPRLLATLNNPEGISALPDGDLIVTEDSVTGRLVRLHKNGEVETLLSGLNRPEGVCVGKDGTIYIAETGTGRVLVFKDGGLRSLVVDLDEPDQVKLSADGSLWITEDNARGRLLRLKDGGLNVILSGLSHPQGLAFTANGGLLVAERGRGRILSVTREEPAP